MNEDDCAGPFGSAKCVVGDAIGDAAGALAGSAIGAFVESVAEAVETVLMVVATTWMNIPSPVVAVGNEPTGIIAAISSDLSFYTMVFAMIGVLFAAGKLALSGRGDAALPAVRMVVTLIIVSAAGAAVVSAAIAAGDAFAPWIIYRATGKEFSDGVVGIMTAATITSSGMGVGLLVGLAALLGCIAQVVFMVFRGAMITLLMAVLPTIAATSATNGGSAALRKALGWLLAFVLYKPVAAVIYAVGLLLVNGYQAPGGTGEEQAAIMSLLMGLTVITLAGLTLPALVKFLVPMASAGVSSMFSGAAVGVAALATGAAVVSIGGSAAGSAAMARGAAPAAARTGAAPAAAGGAGGAAPSLAPAGGGPVAPAGGAAPSAAAAGGTPTAPGAAGGGSSPTPAPASGGSATPGAAPTSGGTNGTPGPVTPPPAPAPAGPAPRGAPAPAASGRGADGWKSAARSAADAARSGTQAADEGGAGPSGAAVER
ncbi:hypothetical protein [uncultured Cellulomonas sp.]|uniref:hypothetical protein n=1 Tax=uncultured Cellulomonas sp. TaxID=189682 RepID=UPI0026217A98|nr:hypothetical protein [uncultured Cellulomonas sp.]